MNRKKGALMLCGLAVLGLLTAGIHTALQADRRAVQTAISIGTQSETVRTIQTKLKQWGYFSGSTDGIFGKGTKEAVIRFQQKNGLTADGVVGKQTLEALGISGTSDNGPGTTAGIKESDRYLLAKVINGEARGEPFLGQVAVGAVVLNRVEHPSFPNTIAGVVYQPLAFTAVADGQIDAEMYESCYRAADMALSGVDPTGGAIYYYNPQTATSKWIFSRPAIKTIGKHIFAK